MALKQLAEFSGLAFVPYIQTCFENIYKLLDHSSEDIRKSALEALTQFIVCLGQNNDDSGVQNAVLIFVPKTAEIIKSDDDCQTVMTALDSFGILLKELKQKVVFNEDLKKTIFTCIENVLNSKVSCQLYDDQEAEEEQEESEYEEALLQVAGDVFPKFGAALTPDEFASYFEIVAAILAAKIVRLQLLTLRNSHCSHFFCCIYRKSRKIMTEWRHKEVLLMVHYPNVSHHLIIA